MGKRAFGLAGQRGLFDAKITLNAYLQAFQKQKSPHWRRFF
ncbi:Uncharacterized protein BN1183_BU_00160 [Pantoea ananatis]|nr:Uncharacterized protein BN1183_BU_00160 [Pantoea ananatis]